MTPDALLVPCPYCGAPAGEACHTARRTIDRTGNPHSDRLDAVRRAKRHGLLPDPDQPSLGLEVR